MSLRRPFSKDTQRKAFARSQGFCECHLMPHIFAEACGRPLGEGNCFYEHIDADRGNNRLSNCACLTKTCWQFKTDEFDKPLVAKIKRASDKAHGIRDPWRRRLPGNRDSLLKIKINGAVVDRASGLPWRGGQ